MGSNEIVRLTGKSDKQQVYQNLRVLINAKILHSKRSRHTGYKEPKFLTGTGRRIKRFVEISERYRESCSHFRKRMTEIPAYIFEEDQSTMPKEKLRSFFDIENPDIKEIKNAYVQILDNTSFLAYPTAMIENILLRYSMLLSEIDEKGAREILTQIVIKIITEEISEMAHDSIYNILRKIHSSKSGIDFQDWFQKSFSKTYYPFVYQAGPIYRNTSLDIWNQVWGLSLRTNILDFSYLKKEYLEMAKMTLRILEPDLESIQTRINTIRDSAKDLEKEGNKREAAREKIIALMCEEAYLEEIACILY